MNTCVKIISCYDHIRRENEKLLRIFKAEQCLKNYEQRYAELKSFRTILNKFAYGNLESDSLKPKITILNNGHVLDHHILGYLAPMEFKRIGFGNIYRTPTEQLSVLNNWLKERGIRFVYVSLPCKIAIYPEIIGLGVDIPTDRIVIPQWRNQLYRLSSLGVEIVDCYDEFQRVRQKGDLYSKNHHISPYGAQVIAKRISDYLRETTILDGTVSEHAFKSTKREIEDYVLRVSGDYSSEKLGKEKFITQCVSMVTNGSDKIYTGEEIESEICIIGNCNLQSYRYTGCDITARLAYDLNYPVNYGGRYLPFAKVDTIDKMPKGLLAGKKILIYVGFLSGSFVRAYRQDDVWSRIMLSDNVF